jgi:hypothetical protein
MFTKDFGKRKLGWKIAIVLLNLFLIANVWWVGRSFILVAQGAYPTFWLAAQHAGDHWGVDVSGYADFWYTHQISIPKIFGWLIKAGEYFFGGIVWISAQIGNLFGAPP